MKEKKKAHLGVRVLLTVGKITLFVLAFPYQIVINRKDGRFSVRSLLGHFSIEKKRAPEAASQDGGCGERCAEDLPARKDVNRKKPHYTMTLSIPGFSAELFRKRRKNAAAPAETAD